MYDVCARAGPYQRQKQRHQYTNSPKKVDRVLFCGWLHRHQFDASERKGRKLQANSEHVTCSISLLARRHARQAVAKEDERLACDSPVTSYKR